MIKKIQYPIFAFIFLGVLIFSCKKNNDSIVAKEMGYNYVPLSDSMSLVYKVTKTEFLYQNTKVTTAYHKELFVKNTATPDTTDYIIYRFVKEKQEDTWKVDSIYAAFKNEKEYVKIENNLAKLNVIFEPYKGRKWNKNMFNNEKESTWIVQGRDTAYQYSTLKYDKALYMNNPANLETAISSLKEFEVYGHQVGLIHSYKRGLNFQPGKDTVGFILDKVYIGE